MEYNKKVKYSDVSLSFIANGLQKITSILTMNYMQVNILNILLVLTFLTLTTTSESSYHSHPDFRIRTLKLTKIKADAIV